MKFTTALLFAPLAAASPHHLPSRDVVARGPEDSIIPPPYYLDDPDHHKQHHHIGTPTNSTLSTLQANQPSAAVTDLLVRETMFNNTLNLQEITYVSFKINGNTTCEGDYPVANDNVFLCGASGPFSFGLITPEATLSTASFGLRIYEQTGPL